MKKLSIFSILLLVALMLTNCKDPEDKLFGGGDGSNSEPYLITSVADLKKMSDMINAGTAPYADAGMNYRLTADIALPTPKPGSVGNLTPIGTNAKKFRGNFDGNGKTISNLTIDNTSIKYIGLFGYVDGGNIQNLGLTGVSIKGGNATGGIAGRIVGGNITNCYVTGTVYGGTSSGGIAGEFDGNISNCYTTCSVTSASSAIGGIAGEIPNFSPPTTLKKCYATGAIMGTFHCGGIIGFISGNTTLVSGCIALNSSITQKGTSGTTFGRVVGYPPNTDPRLTDNAALETMKVRGITVSSYDGKSHNGKDISKANATTESTYRNNPYNWDFGSTDAAPWQWAFRSSAETYQLPVFYWQTSAPVMPLHLKP